MKQLPYYPIEMLIFMAHLLNVFQLSSPVNPNTKFCIQKQNELETRKQQKLKSSKTGKNIPGSETENEGFTYVAIDNRSPGLGKNTENGWSEGMQEPTLTMPTLYTGMLCFLHRF